MNRNEKLINLKKDIEFLRKELNKGTESETILTPERYKISQKLDEKITKYLKLKKQSHQ